MIKLKLNFQESEKVFIKNEYRCFIEEKLIRWCDDTKIKLYYDSTDDSCVYFQNEDDLLAFKLGWL